MFVTILKTLGCAIFSIAKNFAIGKHRVHDVCNTVLPISKVYNLFVGKFVIYAYLLNGAPFGKWDVS